MLRDVSGCLQSAIDADPKNPLAKFEKAAVLMTQEQYQPALTELEALKVCCCLHLAGLGAQGRGWGERGPQIDAPNFVGRKQFTGPPFAQWQVTALGWLRHPL